MVVAVRPWIRVDGTLNRRVLDRLLGAALGIIMQVLINGSKVSSFPPCMFSPKEILMHFIFFATQAPGQTISSVASRLCPALQPAHSRELISILGEMF